MSGTAPRLSRRLLLTGALAAGASGVVGCGVVPGSSRAADVVEIAVAGSQFEPVVELVEGSTAEITWIDLDSKAVLGSGLRPLLETADSRRVGLAATADRRSALADIVTLNLGFNADDDAGRFTIGKDHNHEPQPVVGVSNLTLLTGLVRFCAGGSPLKGALDFSGLASLEHVECFKTRVESVNLAGCSSAIRLCFENTCLTELDLNPVRRTLRDLRAAVQQSGAAGLTLAPLDGPMERLYHYCVRDQVLHQSIPHHQLPVVDEYWVWGTRQQTSDAPTSPAITSYLADYNPFDQASVDLVLATLDERAPDKLGSISLAGESPIGTPAKPSEVGMSHVAALRARGWAVTTN